MPSNREWLNDLAANNPQELNTWFEAEHVAETNVTDGETNGIVDGPPLVDGLPEGDAVEILRKWANFWGVSHSTYTQCDSNWEVTTMRTLADMVERDYVRREKLDAEIKARDACARHAANMEAERDELKKRVDEQRETLDNDCRDLIENDNEICKLSAERDHLRLTVDNLNTQVIELQQDRQAFDYYSERYGEMDAEIAELTAKVDEQSELIAARGKTIETLEKFMSERKYKLKKQLESKTEQCRKLKAERDEYRELYEAAMSTDYGQLSKEHEQFREEISEMLDAAQQIERIRAKHETQSN